MEQEEDEPESPSQRDGWRDFKIGFFGSFGFAVVFALVYFGDSHSGISSGGIIFALVFLAVTFLWPPVIIVISLGTGHPGRALGIVCAGLVMVGLYFAYKELGVYREYRIVSAARVQDVYPFVAPQKVHDVVLIQDQQSTSDEMSDNRGCDQLCGLILMETPYAFAIAERNVDQWRVFHKIQDVAICSDPAHLKSYLGYLEHGITGMCWTMTVQEPARDALIIKENATPGVPTRYEFYERIGGKDNLLGRTVLGDSYPVPQTIKDTAERTIQDRGSFCAIALHLTGTYFPEPRPEQIRSTMSSFLTLLRDPKAVDAAAQAYYQFSPAIGSHDPAIAESLKPGISELLASESPRLITLGLSSLGHVRAFDLSYAKPWVIRHLASHDPKVMQEAVSALYAFLPQNTAHVPDYMAFATGPLGDLVVSDRVSVYGDNYSRLLGVLGGVPGPYATPQRVAAKQQIKGHPDFPVGRLAALFAVIDQGAPENRQEAVDLIMQSTGEPFEKELQAIHMSSGVTFWTEPELAELLKRAKDVPSERLTTYLDAICFQVNFQSLHQQALTLIDQRIAQLTGGSTANQVLAARLADYKKWLQW